MRPWSRRDVLAYLARVTTVIADLDHFALLDVSPGASTDDIQRAFHRVAGGIHPDRHRNALNEEQRERLTIVYARIAEAYRVLRTEESREKYMRKLGRSHAKSESESKGSVGGASSNSPSLATMLSPKARRFYRRSQTALRTGDRTSAVLNLKMALRLHPTSDALKEALTRALEQA